MKYTETFLNSIEQAELNKFADNKTMFEAVKKVLLAGVYFNGTLRPGEDANPQFNFAVNLGDEQRTNEQIGAENRAQAQGIRTVITGFKEIESYKTKDTKDVDNKNPGRP